MAGARKVPLAGALPSPAPKACTCCAELVPILVHLRDQLSKTLLLLMAASSFAKSKWGAAGQQTKKQGREGNGQLRKTKCREEMSLCTRRECQAPPEKDDSLGEGGMGGENESSKISMQTTAGKREMKPLRETLGPSCWPALSTSGEFCGTLRRISEGYNKDRTSCALHLHPPCPYTVTFSDVCSPEGWGRTLFKNLHECFIDF